jgi:hypothetical protein
VRDWIAEEEGQRYSTAMGIATFVEDFKRALELKPIAGSPNVCLIRLRPGTRARDKTELTPEEWDKFEKDIADAFEQIS